MTPSTFLLATLAILCAAPTLATPVCVPAHPLPRDVLTPEVVPEEKMGLEELEKLGDAGNALALDVLGIRYGTGDGVPLNSKKSFQYYKRAAELGSPGAQANLSFMYLSGEGTKKDLELAWQWAVKSKDQGHFRGQEFVGYMLGTGTGVKKDEKEAAFCYLLAARQGSVDSQMRLARLYRGGTELPVDALESARWLARARQASETGKPWIDEVRLTEFPPEWTPAFDFVEELPAEALVRTPNYSFRVKAPSGYSSIKWSRHVGTREKRNTALLIGMQGYDTLGVLVEAQGALADGEDLAAAATRLRPQMTFGAVPGRENCVTTDAAAPYRRAGMLVAVAYCLRAQDKTLYSLSISRKSLALSAPIDPGEKISADVTASMQLLVDSFRFEDAR